MTIERTITPKPYTYGTRVKDAVMTGRLTWNGGSAFLPDLTRYYIGRDGYTLSIFRKDNRAAIVKVVWNANSDTAVIKVNGEAPFVATAVNIVIVENGTVVVQS